MNSLHTGVLLINLGTPEAPTPAAVRRYLAEFLSDPRVVEIPQPLWKCLLWGLVLPLRSRSSARLYQKIWQAEGSPLRIIAKRQQQALQQALAPHFPQGVTVALGMRYGKPSMADALKAFQQAGIERVLILPLYPQYAAATTASTFDKVAAIYKTLRTIPHLRFVSEYHLHPDYIVALADRIQKHWEIHGQADRLLFSFHGIPQRSADAGDPYPLQCHATAQAIADRLQLPTRRWQVVFQSRFGRARWLKPYCTETLITLPREKVRSVDVICPGFSADCLETLEEIALQNRDRFLAAGGEQFRYIPALNDSPSHIQALTHLIIEHTQGWLIS